MSDELLTVIAYANRECAKASEGAARNYEATMAVLTVANEGPLSDPLPLSHRAIKAMVRSAFLAGCNFEFDRRERDG